MLSAIRRGARLALFFSVVVSASAIAERNPMDIPRLLLDTVDRLADGGRRLSASAVAKQWGTALVPLPGRSDEYTIIFTGAADSALLFEGVELRLPGPAAKNSSQLLDLSVAGSHCVPMTEVTQRYGQGELSVPTPRQPAGSPVYLTFTRPWGSLSFGFASDPSSCLRKVVIDVQSASPT